MSAPNPDRVLADVRAALEAVVADPSAPMADRVAARRGTRMVDALQPRPQR